MDLEATAHSVLSKYSRQWPRFSARELSQSSGSLNLFSPHCAGSKAAHVCWQVGLSIHVHIQLVASTTKNFSHIPMLFVNVPLKWLNNKNKHLIALFMYVVEISWLTISLVHFGVKLYQYRPDTTVQKHWVHSYKTLTNRILSWQLSYGQFS